MQPKEEVLESRQAAKMKEIAEISVSNIHPAFVFF
jgi:hypothetical protein